MKHRVMITGLGPFALSVTMQIPHFNRLKVFAASMSQQNDTENGYNRCRRSKRLESYPSAKEKRNGWIYSHICSSRRL